MAAVAARAALSTHQSSAAWSGRISLTFCHDDMGAHVPESSGHSVVNPFVYFPKPIL